MRSDTHSPQPRPYTSPQPRRLIGWDVAPGVIVIEREHPLAPGGTQLLELRDGDHLGVARHPEMGGLGPNVTIGRIGRPNSPGLGMLRVCPTGAALLGRDISVRVLVEAWLGLVPAHA